MKKKNSKIELLAPAGNLEKAVNAFAFGADAVYLGVPDFSLRARINDFDNKKIEKIVKIAREKKKKVYVTLNIFAHHRHFDKLKKHVKFLKKIEVDALIISDPGVIALVREVWPKAVIHLSTQANCTNWRAAHFWQKAGVKRVILGRETPLTDIQEIHWKCPKLELEVFVHGAMCMAYSGRCFLSKYLTGRSGNLGDCAQPCRWSYDIKSPLTRGAPDQGEGGVCLVEEKKEGDPLELVEDKNGSYLLSSKDLCLIEYLPELVAAGVSSFKIEGRTKSVYYQAVVVNAYRQAVCNLQSANTKLQKIEYKKFARKLFNELDTRLVHRGYFTGFLFGGRGEQETERSRNAFAWEFAGQAVSNKQIANNPSTSLGTGKYQIKIKVHNTLRINEEIEVARPFMPTLETKIEKMVDVKNNKEISEAHGGSGGQTVMIETAEDWPVYSVIRRKIK